MALGGYGAAAGDSKMRFLKRRFLRSVEKWDAAWIAYQQHLSTILDQLPDIARKLLKWNFHDQGVHAIQQIDKKTIWIELDDERLEFYGVSHAICPSNEQLDCTCWLYEEVDLVSPGVFAMRALFDEYGFEVHATDAKIFRPSLNRYILPAEPSPPPPTLFADRQTRHSAGRRKKGRNQP